VGLASQSPESVELMQRSHIESFGLLGLASGLVAIHLSLVFRGDNTDLIGSSVLYWLAIAILFSRKRDRLKLGSDRVSTMLGTSLIAIVLLKSWFIVGSDIFLRLSPALSIVGVGLIASGRKGMKQYRHEIGLLILFVIPPGLVLLLFDPSLLTAKFAGFALWCLGFQVSVQGITVSLPRGAIDVYTGCSGVAIMLQLLGVALMNLFLVVPRVYQQIVVPAIAVLIAFVVNGLRVALLAVIVALGNQEAFDYWHVGDGSLVFSTIAVVIFSLMCQQLLPSEAGHDKDV
jgi:cyanoexosortase A